MYSSKTAINVTINLMEINMNEIKFARLAIHWII
jgi:hypothetical protein